MSVLLLIYSFLISFNLVLLKISHNAPGPTKGIESIFCNLVTLLYSGTQVGVTALFCLAHSVYILFKLHNAWVFIQTLRVRFQTHYIPILLPSKVLEMLLNGILFDCRDKILSYLCCLKFFLQTCTSHFALVSSVMQLIDLFIFQN